MRIRGSIIRSCSLSLLKAIISTLTDAKVGGGQKPVNPARLPPRPRSPTPRAVPVANRWPRGAPTGSTAPGAGGGIRLFCGGISAPPDPAVAKAGRAARPPPHSPARPLPLTLGLPPAPEGGGPGVGVNPSAGPSRARPPAVLPPVPLLVGYLQTKLAALPGPQPPPACLVPHMLPCTKECPAGLP